MPPPPAKRHKSHATPARPAQGSTGASINTLKKKIRDTERLLGRNAKLPATVRLENERLLSAFKYELARATHAQKEHKIRRKYHMVRFFERQKATRRLKKLNRELAEYEAADAPEELRQRIKGAEVDLNYTLYYPAMEKYISLWPKVAGTDTKVDEKREMIRKDIENRMENGTLGDVTASGDEHDDEEYALAAEGPNAKVGKKQDSEVNQQGQGKGKRKQGSYVVEKTSGRIEDDDFFDFD